MRKIIIGQNDLYSSVSEIAKEADGWDPSFILFAAHKKFSWKCSKGHQWKTTPNKRTGGKTGCPYCSNQKVLRGFNDLKTKL